MYMKASNTFFDHHWSDVNRDLTNEQVSQFKRKKFSSRLRSLSEDLFYRKKTIATKKLLYY